MIRAIEQSPLTASTYDLNTPGVVEVGNVVTAKAEGRCDVIIAGPPCQGFSTLGKRDQSDPRNRLSLQVLRWAAAMKPSVIVIENVASFIESDVWKMLATRLERLGYCVTADICDAADFGVPQYRVRSATLASRLGPIVMSPRHRRHVAVPHQGTLSRRCQVPQEIGLGRTRDATAASMRCMLRKARRSAMQH